MVTIQVVNTKTGKPEENKKVYITFGSGWGKKSTEDVWTDDRGEAHFDAKPGEGKVVVNGSKEYEGMTEGRVVVYI